MALAARNFNAQQALEKECKELYAKFTCGTPVAAEATFNLTADVTIVHALAGDDANGGTVTLQVAAAAANPTDTILCAVTGSASAITITITPNDGTNNSATPVDLTTAEFAELLDSGTVVGKTVTITDASSRLALIASASGGGATALADSGEGDGVIATWADGDDDLSDDSVAGVYSITRSTAGEYTITLEDAYYALKSVHAIHQASTAEDIAFQVKSEAVATAKTVVLVAKTGNTPTDPADSTVVLVKLELKNSSVTA